MCIEKCLDCTALKNVINEKDELKNTVTVLTKNNADILARYDMDTKILRNNLVVLNEQITALQSSIAHAHYLIEQYINIA